MYSNTLTSLAILKVNVDHGRDYLDYIRPFILHVLVKNNPERITDSVVQDLISNDFGLKIPKRVVEIVLRRIARRRYIERNSGVYKITSVIPDPQLTPRMADAGRHIAAVVKGLREFSTETKKQISNDGEAIDAICSFLNEFGITCLRSYLQGTTIPVSHGIQRKDIVLVSEYVQHLRRSAPLRFKSFIVLVQGHMLANALTCPDLRNAPKNFKNVTFYIDTPILVRAIGADGDPLQRAARDLLTSVSRLGGRIAVFSHSREELQRVLQGAADSLERPNARSAIVFEARRKGATRSDLLLLAESVDDHLNSSGVAIETTPNYIEKFQIDETAFEKVLDDEVSYLNPRAKQYDINSVRSIYVIRATHPAPSLERSKAVFVTSNGGFAKAAWEYGQVHESSRSVSSVITDFALANIAWLKEPMETPSIPISQLLAISYAALEPSSELLEKFMTEIDRLATQGSITARDHQLLRSSPLVHGDLVHMTLGEESALTEETITETLSRVKNEIRKEESERLTAEQRDHQETRDALGEEEQRSRHVARRLYSRCQRRAAKWARCGSSVLTVLLFMGVLSGLNSYFGVRIISLLSLAIFVPFGLMTFLNIFCGISVSGIHDWLESKFMKWFIRRESNDTGIDFNEL